MFRNIGTFVAAALAILAFALTPTAAKAQSFTGDYPVLETQVKGGIAGNIKGGNESFCLELTDNGSLGRVHSGTASLESDGSGNFPGGTFYVIGNTIIADFEVGSETGESDSLVLVAPANPKTGEIGTGVMGLTGGVPSSGLATVGAKNGC